MYLISSALGGKYTPASKIKRNRTNDMTKTTAPIIVSPPLQCGMLESALKTFEKVSLKY
jgi:hypothetical protein